MENTNLNIKVLGVIPARLASTRVPEKMLADINGKTLIERTIERSMGAKSLDALIVTTDSERIVDVVKKLGLEVIMTSPDLPTGTDRTGEALKSFTEFKPDIVVTIWGDEPLYEASVINDCVKRLIDNPDLHAVAAADKISNEKMLNANSVVKVVTDKKDRALYISRSVIPYVFREHRQDYYHISGAMAMRADFLMEYIKMEQTPLELTEGVEQLRMLENGYKLGIVKGDIKNLGVNTLEELEEVKMIYKERENK